MQGNGAKWKKIVMEIIPVALFALLLVADQLTKLYVKDIFEKEGWIETVVIPKFFEFTYVFNTGAAFSFLANVSWGQLFFKILTPIALVAFIIFYVYTCKKNYVWAKFALALIIAGTIGNYIDRLCYGGVVDFISLIFGSYYFPVFNIADICMTVGVIMLIAHFLFLDEGAIFRKKKNNG